jgi:hypothetical protein
MSTATLVDIVLAAIVLEAGVLLAVLRHRPARLRAGILAMLAAGAALIITLRVSISGAEAPLLAACLLLSLLAHLTDLYFRLVRSP